jgi:hypothetical protein
MPWDAEQYGCNIGNGHTTSGTEVRLLKKFPPVVPRHIMMPCTIEDQHKRIIAWYLPGVLTTQRQVSIKMYKMENYANL